MSIETVEMVNVNTVWKVVNGCRRVQRELAEGRSLQSDLVTLLQEQLQLTMEALRDAGY